jgi:hypothetical protein
MDPPAQRGIMLPELRLPDPTEKGCLRGLPGRDKRRSHPVLIEARHPCIPHGDEPFGEGGTGAPDRDPWTTAADLLAHVRKDALYLFQGQKLPNRPGFNPSPQEGYTHEGSLRDESRKHYRQGAGEEDVNGRAQAVLNFRVTNKHFCLRHGFRQWGKIGPSTNLNRTAINPGGQDEEVGGIHAVTRSNPARGPDADFFNLLSDDLGAPPLGLCQKKAVKADGLRR